MQKAAGGAAPLKRLEEQVLARRVNWLTSIRDWQVRRRPGTMLAATAWQCSASHTLCGTAP